VVFGTSTGLQRPGSTPVWSFREQRAPDIGLHLCSSNLHSSPLLHPAVAGLAAAPSVFVWQAIPFTASLLFFCVLAVFSFAVLRHGYRLCPGFVIPRSEIAQDVLFTRIITI
jgi:hypothetical protein